MEQQRSILVGLRNIFLGNREKQKAVKAADRISLKTPDLSRTRFITTATSKIPVLVVKKRKIVLVV
jgi:hypothetical protein